MKRALLIGLLLSAAGCIRPSEPMLAGGKPVQHWLDALHRPVAKVRKEAVAKLGNVSDADPAAFPAVLQALRDNEATVRREAIVALLKFDQHAEEAIPELSELRAHDPDATVRKFAQKALRKLQTKRQG